VLDRRRRHPALAVEVDERLRVPAERLRIDDRRVAEQHPIALEPIDAALDGRSGEMDDAAHVLVQAASVLS